jgi:hypothetical protein
MTRILRLCIGATMAVALAMAPLTPAGAAPGSFTDPDDVNLPLDLKTLTHDLAGATVVYTVETFESFEDKQADFKWALDTNNDQKIDRLVSVEWDGGLVAKVEDSKENELGGATVERAGPQSLRVSFGRDLIGAASYQYRVIAVTDKNGNEEDDKGETDVAPDGGFHPHQL